MTADRVSESIVTGDIIVIPIDYFLLLLPKSLLLLLKI
jgi:trehalose-6-phosphate synthase